MPPSNIEVVRAVVGRFQQRRLRRCAGAAARRTSSSTGHGACSTARSSRGHDEVRRFMQGAREIFDEIHIPSEEMTDLGDGVVLLVGDGAVQGACERPRRRGQRREPVDGARREGRALPLLPDEGGRARGRLAGSLGRAWPLPAQRSSSWRRSLISSRSLAAYSKRSSSAAANISSSSSTISFSISSGQRTSSSRLARRRFERGTCDSSARKSRDVGDALLDRLGRDAVLARCRRAGSRGGGRSRRSRRASPPSPCPRTSAPCPSRSAPRGRSSGSGWSRRAGSPPCRRRGSPTSDTSGRSSPSRSRFTPTSTSYSPSRRSRMIWMRSIVSISECR